MVQKNNSKKKRKGKKAPTMKRRYNQMTFSITADEEGRILIDRDELGRFYSEQRITTLYSETRYDRDSGKPKIVSRTAGNEGFVHLDPLRNIVSNYDVITCADTNRFLFKNKEVCVCASVRSTSEIYDLVENAKFESLEFSVFFDVKGEINPETIGWHLLITEIFPKYPDLAGKKICLVVDSDLGLLDEINRREKPYYDNFFLPENVDLAYASSDSSGNALNSLIKMCDRISNEICEDVEKGNITLNGFPNIQGDSYKLCGIAKLPKSE
ncbi:hypothetical protein [Marinobacter salsuginis]|uniref:hypothetical protein n=1 Tax=Marinobacter salsuginis TaxID=418719 RepID=UPI00273FB970|nr:hypothetical protein [Marinobacter salsuginis]